MSENKSVCIMVDTGSDMLPEEAEKLSITLLPLTVRFGNEEFNDGFTISRDEFYQRLSQGVIPKTSLIATDTYQQQFQQAINNHQEVVCLCLSSGISGCYQSAMIAAEDFKNQVFVVDTQQFCGSEYLLALRAVELRKQEYSAKEIAEKIEEEKKIVKIVAIFDTLEYLKLGGRISAAAAAIGNMLLLKPYLTIAEGGVSILGKARGSKMGANKLMQFIQDNGGIDWQMPVLFSYSGSSRQNLDKFIEESSSLYIGHDVNAIPVSRVGATIGSYTGPGAFAISFFPKNK